MEILLLGGTGAMGEYLSDILSSRGNKVVVTSRSYRKSKNNVEYINGNAQDINFLSSLLIKKWDAIIDFMVYSTAQFKERVRLLLNATVHYVFLSSARVYANSKDPVIESSPRLLDTSDDEAFLKTDEYSLTKARQENILRDSGMSNWTILRPYITFSPKRLQLGIFEKEDWLYRALKGRTIVFSDDINSKYTTLTLGLDVAKGISALIGKEEFFGEAFHITNNNPIKWSEILDCYLGILENHLGYRPKVKFEDKETYTEGNPSIYQIIYDRFFDRKFDNSKIANIIDASNFTDTKQGLKSCLEEFLNQPHFKPINWGAEAIKDRKTNEFASLSEISGAKQKIKYLIYRFISK